MYAYWKEWVDAGWYVIRSSYDEIKPSGLWVEKSDWTGIERASEELADVF